MTERSEKILDMMTEIILQYFSIHRDEENREIIAVNEKEN